MIEIHPTKEGYGLWDTERQKWHIRDESHAIVDRVADCLVSNPGYLDAYTECDEIADRIRETTGEDTSPGHSP